MNRNTLIPTRKKVQNPIMWAIRYLAGWPLDGYDRSDSTYFHPGTVDLTQKLNASRWEMLAGWQRQAWRLGIPVAAWLVTWAYLAHPTLTTWAATLGALALGWWLGGKAYRRMVEYRFRRLYLGPLDAAIRGQLGAGRRDPLSVYVSPDLPGLAARLATEMSPAGAWLRTQYGRWVAPVLWWLPERVMRLYWWATERTGTPGSWAALFRVAREESMEPAVSIRIPGRFIDDETRQKIGRIVAAKLGLTDLEERWNQVGRVATALFTVRPRPRRSVTLDNIMEAVLAAKENELIPGLAAGDKPMVLSLDDDSPHFACSAGSGAGKSVLAMILAFQILLRGGQVIILDRKGSHRWARGLAGVLYCSRPADMHAALIGAAQEADRRNTQAMEEEDEWDPGHRVFVIFEEMNATVAQLKNYWDSVRGKGQPKVSPAIQAFRELMYMGRSAKYHLFGVAQMLTAATTGGPEARENFGVRALARYTANNWKMLAPECPMPKKSKVRGRWQFVVAGEATEVQVAFATAAEIRAALARVVDVPVSTTPVSQGATSGTGPTEDSPADPLDELVTLRDAFDRGVVHGRSLDAVKKRLQRDDNAPRPRGMDGTAHQYRVGDLAHWDESQSVLGGESA